MKITFRIQYHTVWGESLRVILNDDETRTLELTTRDGVEWHGSFDYPLNEALTYRYGVSRAARS